MHTEHYDTLLFLALVILVFGGWLVQRSVADARWIAKRFFDEVDDNPTNFDGLDGQEKVLPPSQPPLPTPEQAIEGVLKAIRDQKATTTNQIPVLCYSGQVLTNLQAAVAECDALKAMLQERVNASLV